MTIHFEAKGEWTHTIEDKYWEQQWLIGEYEEIIYHRLHKPMWMHVPLDQEFDHE